MKTISFSGKQILFVLALVMLLGACRDKMKDDTFRTDLTVNIYTYINEKDPDFSEFAKILRVTKLASILDTYGEFTVFAPTNEAVLNYYKAHGRTSIDDYKTQADIDTLVTLVKYCTLSGKVSSFDFVEGSIPDSTYSGDFLTTSYVGDEIIVSREAKILQKDLGTLNSNGYIHKIDKVLSPLTRTIADFFANTPKFSIFHQALVETGLSKDTLEKRFSVVVDINGQVKQVKTRLTVLAESDSVFNVSGIYSYADLKNKYCNTGNPANKYDDLYKFMANHIVKDFLFTSKFERNKIYLTCNPSVLSVSMADDYVTRINEHNNKYVTFILGGSENIAKNGIVHMVDNLLEIYSPPAARMYWEPYDVPEVAPYRGKNGSDHTFYNGDIVDIQWTDGVAMSYLNPYVTSKYRYLNGDHLQMQGAYSITFTTPTLVPGTYEVWFGAKNNKDTRSKVQCYWDGKLFGSPYDMGLGDAKQLNCLGAGKSSTKADPEDSIKLFNEYKLRWYPDPNKFKEFTYLGETNANGYLVNDLMRKLIGEVTITTPSRHKFRVQTITPKNMILDFIWFVPK